MLDPNGEYSRAFSDGQQAQVFKVHSDTQKNEKELQVPLWFWNSAEWVAFTQASEKIQSPLLRRALREVKAGRNNLLEAPSEDVPIPFVGTDFANHLEILSKRENVQQFLDSLIMRVRTMLSDTRMKSIVSDGQKHITLDGWLNNHLGDKNITIIDLSMVPSEVIHIITAVIARMVFEALQRYRKLKHQILPTVMVIEEAHTFVKRYKEDAENQNATSVCCQVFEKIAREGRKFGLGLVVSSQRPSELSPTVLSQCNTFLLHRISNDRDQDLVSRFVPDNLRGLLRELPSLPSQQAILMGWASELPLLVKINDLPEGHQPQSDDPGFWNVWTGTDKKERKTNWKGIADDWQGNDR